MTKRPLKRQFADAVGEGRKICTIRNQPWPVGRPIMLYAWAGKAYASKHVDIAAVQVYGWLRIKITHREGGAMVYAPCTLNGQPLWTAEGFDSREAMDEHFREVVPPGRCVTMFLNCFKLLS